MNSALFPEQSHATPDAAAPRYLSGAYNPVLDEISATELHVEGTIPAHLRGRYLRNGANPLQGEDLGHGFLGQGMIHGVRIANGRAEWYRNRWVKTLAMNGARVVDSDGNRNLLAGSSNTDVVQYAGLILALVESALPYVVTPDLETAGAFDFDGALRGPMTAHPKRDPVTGEFLFFGYSAQPPYATFHVAAPNGKLRRSEPVTLCGPTLMHDFAITEKHVIWFDLPHQFDPELIGKTAMPYRWRDQYRARIGVMPRSGGDSDVRWYPVSACMLYHVANAYESERGQIVIHAVRYDEQQHKTMWREYGGIEAPGAAPVSGPYLGGNLYEWVLDPHTGKVAERRFDDLGLEFPVVNKKRTGLPHRYVYAVGHPFVNGGRLVKYDTRQPEAKVQVREFGPGEKPGEPCFVPRPDATAEDDGVIIILVSHEHHSAKVLILNAKDINEQPIATISLPRRVPGGFHGSWIDDSELGI